MQAYAEIPVAFWACCHILLARAADSRDTHSLEHLEPKTFWKAASNVAYRVAPEENGDRSNSFTCNYSAGHNVNKVCIHKHTVKVVAPL